MAQSDSDGICRIVRLGHGLQIQQSAGHILHLMLGGVAVAHDSLLDLHGLILMYGDSGLTDSKEDHPPGLSDPNTGGNILTEKQLFNGYRMTLLKAE